MPELQSIAADNSIQSIPVPPSPQATKSSNEILCELFGAFNATPPPLDDLIPVEGESLMAEKIHKKHKKHKSKKKHKKLKNKKRASSSESKISRESKKKNNKKHKKHSTSDCEPLVTKKKKKRKLGKFSASDSDIDEEEPEGKKRKKSKEKCNLGIKTEKIKIKEEKEDFKDSNTVLDLTTTTIPKTIQENLLKHAVSQIVDKVIGSTDMASEICKSIATIKTSESNSCQVINTQIKQEPNIDKHQDEKLCTSSIKEKSCTVDEHKEISKTKSGCSEITTKALPIADVFAEDLIDCGIKTDTLKKSDKPKPVIGKITIPNLKFSQVYEATVKKIEEEAKLKAEKYEEGELSESSVEERSPTPSEFSSSGSLIEDQRIVIVKKKKHRHRHRHGCHSRKQSKSDDKHQSHSHSGHSRSHHRHHHHREQPGEKNEEKIKEHERSRERGVNREEIRRTSSRERDKIKRSSRERGKRKSNSRERDRSSRERDRSRRRTSSREKDRRSSKDRDRSKERRRSKERDRSKEKSKDRSWITETSNERGKSKDKNKDREKRRYGHSNRSNSRDSEEKIDKQKLLEIARKNALNMMKNPSGASEQTKLAITSGGKTVHELTDFCKLLSQKDADGHESISSNTSHSSDSESEKPFHHPFQIKDRPSNIVLNIRNSVALPVKSLQEKTAEQSRQLRLQFPVSSGQHHRKTENEWIPVSPKKTEITTTPVNTQVAVVKPTTKPSRVFKDSPDPPNVDIGSIVSQRLSAMRRLQENPTDSEALSQMYAAQQSMQHWAESKQQPPGQFTGSTGVKVLSQAELNSGYQAWARRDQLQVAAPVNSGMGMTLLQKMGWRPGEGLGKNKEGTLQPLLLEVKMDKKGLVAQEELPVRQPHHPTVRGPPRSLEGKHPVSLLNEYCCRRKFGPPLFEIVNEVGPDHKKNFLYKVLVNGVEYKPAVGSPKKKQARAEAAEVCLKALGILPNK